VVIYFSVEQESFGRDATNVAAGATEFVVLFDQAGLQAKLAGAKGG
jgi:hypothetical protein